MKSAVKIDRHNNDAEKPAESDANLFITAFTDGSHCPETNAWGVGVWIRDGQSPAHMDSFGGVGLENSFKVELEGIRFVEKYIKDNCDYKDRVLVVQCDNINALALFNKSHFKGAKFIKLKHVKAHTSNKTRRTYVNSLVDDMAKVQMRMHREKVAK